MAERALSGIRILDLTQSASEAVTTAPPLAGQHTAEVLGEVLGLSTDDVADLQRRGAVG